MSNNNINDFFSFTRRLSLKNRNNYEKYHYILDFDNTNEKECRKLDKLNEQIYQKNLKYFSTIQKYLNEKKAIFKLNDSPSAPKEPSNYDSLILYRKRNQLFNCREQTLAIMYLIYNDFTLVIDKTIRKFRDNNKFFEPYMAIELATKLGRKRKEEYMEIIEKRINDDNDVDEEEPEPENTEICGSIANLNLPSYNDIVNPEEEKKVSPEKSFNIQSTVHTHNGLICNNPEHHTVNDKISHFNNVSSFYPNLGNFNVEQNNIHNQQIPQTSIYPSAPQTSAPQTSAPSAPPIPMSQSITQPLPNMSQQIVSSQQVQFNNGQMPNQIISQVPNQIGFNPTLNSFNSNESQRNNQDTCSQKKDKKKKNTLKDKINNKSKSSTTYQINIHSNNTRSDSLSSHSSGSDLNV